MTRHVQGEGLSPLQDLPQKSYFKTTLTRRWGKVHRVWRDSLVTVELSAFGSADVYNTPYEVPDNTWQLAGIHPNCRVEPEGLKP